MLLKRMDIVDQFDLTFARNAPFKSNSNARQVEVVVVAMRVAPERKAIRPLDDFDMYWDFEPLADRDCRTSIGGELELVCITRYSAADVRVERRRYAWAVVHEYKPHFRVLPDLDKSAAKAKEIQPKLV